jgi:type VI secretion system protein ImpB
VPKDVSPDTENPQGHDEVHIGYLAIPPLDRLMTLRNALVALKGPLASEPGVQENLRRHVFNQETENRVLGKRDAPMPCALCSLSFDTL